MEHYIYNHDEQPLIQVIEEQLKPLTEALMIRKEMLHLFSRTQVRTIHHDTIDEMFESIDSLCLRETKSFRQFLEKRELF